MTGHAAKTTKLKVAGRAVGLIRQVIVVGETALSLCRVRQKRKISEIHPII
jgi:hypothetical protein